MEGAIFEYACLFLRFGKIAGDIALIRHSHPGGRDRYGQVSANVAGAHKLIAKALNARLSAPPIRKPDVRGRCRMILLFLHNSRIEN
jgi:hypothetical protein